MSFAVVVGCQWGDEGKGKIVDLLAADFDWVARFQGGANAGHTVYANGRQFILHLVPTGVLRAGVRCALGNGMVIDAEALLDEIRALEEGGVPCRERLYLSAQAHVVTPLHKAREGFTSQDRLIGTTGRGIGPAYEDRASRFGLRFEHLLDREVLRDRLAALWERLQPWAAAAGTTVADAVGATREELTNRLAGAGRALAPMLCDVSDLLLLADDRGERILCEGAQGTWLDVDHGTYPFVTSSNTSVGGACTGLGIPPRRISRVMGVVKAYTTRVGHGPFPTEFAGTFAEAFRQKAGEFGATTQRPRRCGWYDAVLVRRSVRLNGVDELVVTKLDVMTGQPKLHLAVRYRSEGPSAGAAAAGGAWHSGQHLGEAEPEYRVVAGWSEPIEGIREPSDLPHNAVSYLELLAQESGTQVALVSVGPGREQTLRMCR